MDAAAPTPSLIPSPSESPSPTSTALKRHGLNDAAEKIADDDYEGLIKLKALFAAMPDRVEGTLDVNMLIPAGESSALKRAHYVEAENAWISGLFALDAKFLSGFLTDPLNLVDVDLGLPSAQRRGLAHQWLPTDDGMRCLYVARQVKVKTKYGLGTEAEEREALKKELTACAERKAQAAAEPENKLDNSQGSSEARENQQSGGSTGSSAGNSQTHIRHDGAPAHQNPAPAAPVHNNPAPPPPPAPEPEPAQPAPPRPRADMTYKNCTEVWDALGRPITRGEPGYAPHLDENQDGVGCEKPPRRKH